MTSLYNIERALPLARPEGSDEMPCYEYRCESNGRTVEVRHGMHERLETWGELAMKAGVEPGDAPRDAPTVRLMSVPARPSVKPEAQGCGPGCACAREA